MKKLFVVLAVLMSMAISTRDVVSAKEDDARSYQPGIVFVEDDTTLLNRAGRRGAYRPERIRL